MKKLLVMGLMAAGMLGVSSNANAQLGGLLKKAAKGVVDKAKKTVSDTAEGTVNSATGAATGTTTGAAASPFAGGFGFGAVASSYEEEAKPEVPKDEMSMSNVKVGMTDASLISSLAEYVKNGDFFSKNPNRKFLRVVIESSGWEYKRDNLGNILGRMIKYGFFYEVEGSVVYCSTNWTAQPYNGSGYDNTWDGSISQRFGTSYLRKITDYK